MQMVTIFKYRALPVPSEITANHPGLAGPGNPDSSPTETPAERFASQLSDLAKEGKAVQVLTFPGFVLVGEIAGFMGMEQTVMPAMMAPGTGLDLRAPQRNRGNRGD